MCGCILQDNNEDKGLEYNKDKKKKAINHL